MMIRLKKHFVYSVPPRTSKLPRMAITRVCFSAILNRPHRSLAPVFRIFSSTSTTQSENNSPEPSGHPDAPDFSMENPFLKEKRQCILCKYKIQLDYKNTRLLSQFVSSYTGQIYERHITGLCAKQHEILKNEIKKAKSCHYIPVIHKNVKFVKDPQLYDPFRPERPNPF